MARLQAFSQQINIAKQATAESTHKLLVETAKREHARVMLAEPKPGGFERYVDGREGAPEESVRPFGVITYLYSRYDEIVEFALEALRAGSPVDSGEYRKSHTLYVGGEPAANLAGYNGVGEIFIANPVEYSRIIELGKMKMRVPGTDHVYEKAARKVAARYGNLASVKFTYRTLSPSAGRTKQDKQDDQDARVPALLIRPL